VLAAAQVANTRAFMDRVLVLLVAQAAAVPHLRVLMQVADQAQQIQVAAVQQVLDTMALLVAAPAAPAS
tara:strand:- start:22 stop:228 length:207 start_codon:yes stop_codon:yes gene_type:complete